MFWKLLTKGRFGMIELDYDVNLQRLKRKFPPKYESYDMTLPWPLFDEMLVSLPLDNLLCCSSSLTFGVTQLSIYRLDIIPIYLSPLAISALFVNWGKYFWKLRFLKHSRIFWFFDKRLRLRKVFIAFWKQLRWIIVHDIPEVFANQIECGFWAFQLTTTTTTVKHFHSSYNHKKNPKKSAEDSSSTSM